MIIHWKPKKEYLLIVIITIEHKKKYSHMVLYVLPSRMLKLTSSYIVVHSGSFAKSRIIQNKKLNKS